MKRSSVQKLGSFFQNQVGRFLATQLTHTVITAVILIGFFFGATQVGALDSVLAPTAQTTGSSFTTINYQGRLADPDGAPISDTLTFQFSLYDAPSDGNLLWGPEVHADVPVSDGLFSVRLGQQDALPTNIFNGGDVWLETTVKGETLSPREKLAAVPYAMVAGEVLTVSSLDAPDGDPQDALVVDEDGKVGVHTTDPTDRLSVVGNIASMKLGTEGSGQANVGMRIGIWNEDNEDWESNWHMQTAAPDGGHGVGARNFEIWEYPEDAGDDCCRPRFVIENSNGQSTGGTVTIEDDGDLVATGSKSAVVETETYGARRLYAFEQPTNRFGDEGRAELVDGTARVALDPIFLETVEDDFLIHLTPYGDASLYVADIGVDYFVVRAREGADDVPFAWMLTATRSGYEGVRLEEAETP
jgi:hypothetical protein